MSWQQVEGHWKQFIGEAKKRWAKLTDDDLKACEGNRDLLVGKLQALYGMDQVQAGEEIATLERHLVEARKGGEKMYGGV